MRTAFLFALLVLCPAICFAQTPSADIKCNGLDSGIIVTAGSNAKIDFAIVAGFAAGTPADIWIVLKTPFGFFTYDGSGAIAGWWFDLDHAYATGPLADAGDTVLDQTVPLGAYKAHVGIDNIANGLLDLGNILLNDVVDFRVTQFPDMAFIPEGAFEMGDHQGGGDWDELPVHNVQIDAFFMDIFDVTNDQYCTFLNSAYGLGLIEVNSGTVYKNDDTEPYCDTSSYTQYSRILWDGNTFSVTSPKEDHPMVMVSWYGAAAYANWRSVQDGLTPCYDLNTWNCDFNADGYRLPTEAEWEKAARGGEQSPYYMYPWGNNIDGSAANYESSGDPFEGTWPETTPVGYYDGNQIPAGVDMANGYGLYGMAGNVWEWCNDRYDPSYYGTSPNDNPRGPASGSSRILRSGSWISSTHSLRCANRYDHGPGNRYCGRGFRLAVD
jgi:formylglycine-generating enzyme required for sulfatase activity